MSRPISIVLCIASFLTVLATASLYQRVEVTEREVTVLRAQAASHAEIMLLDRDIGSLSVRAAQLEQWHAALEVRLTVLEETPPDVTVAKMIVFSDNIADQFLGDEARIDKLEREIDSHRL